MFKIPIHGFDAEARLAAWFRKTNYRKALLQAQGDPASPKYGRLWLRKFSWELPQLYKTCCLGTCRSLPRVRAAREVKTLYLADHRRLGAKPGINLFLADQRAQ